MDAGKSHPRLMGEVHQALGRNMKFGIAALVVVGLAYAAAPGVDPTLVGTWQMVVPNSDGVAIWVWDVHANGTYSFHAEGPGNIASHRGTFEAAHGTYSLKATTMDWEDRGTYEPPTNNVLRATGRLGTGLWKRVTTADIQPSAASAPSGIPPNPSWKSFANLGKGVAENGNGGDFDEATSAWIKLKNQGKIVVHGLADALVEGSMSNTPVILFYSGGLNIDALLYSDAMVTLAPRATFGLVERGPDIQMRNSPHSQNEFKDQSYPRALVVTPLFPDIQLFKALDRKRAGQDPGPLFEFVWEQVGASSAQEYAARIGAELRKLGH